MRSQDETTSRIEKRSYILHEKMYFNYESKKFKTELGNEEVNIKKNTQKLRTLGE